MTKKALAFKFLSGPSDSAAPHINGADAQYSLGSSRAAAATALASTYIALRMSAGRADRKRTRHSRAADDVPVQRSRSRVRSDEKEALITAHALIESKYEQEWSDYREALPEIAARGHTEEELKSRWLADNARRLSREADPARGGSLASTDSEIVSRHTHETGSRRPNGSQSPLQDEERGDRRSSTKAGRRRDRSPLRRTICSRPSTRTLRKRRAGASSERVRDKDNHRDDTSSAPSAIGGKACLPMEYPVLLVKVNCMKKAVTSWGTVALSQASSAVELALSGPLSLDDVHELAAGAPPAMFAAAELGAWRRCLLDLTDDPGARACERYVDVIRVVLTHAADIQRELDASGEVLDAAAEK